MSEIDQKTLRESILRKEKIRALTAQLAERDAELARRDERIAELENSVQEYETSINEYLAAVEAEEQPMTPEQEELESYRSKERVSRFQKAIDDSGKFASGVKAEHVAAISGLPLHELDAVEDMDALIGDLFNWTQENAPIFARVESVTQQPAEAVNGRPSGSAGVAKRLPTFASTGGGTPPPVEQSLSAARLRDPAAAQERAAQARASNQE